MKRGINRINRKIVMARSLSIGLAVSFFASTALYAAENAALADAAHGKNIFMNICSHCHNASFEESAVGAPGLMDVLDRHSEEWIFKWLQGPGEFAKKDETAKALVESNSFGLVMPTLPDMQDAQNRRDVIAFLKTLKSE